MNRTALVGLLALVSWSAQAAQNVPGWRIGAAATFGTFQGDEVSEALPNKFIEDNSVGIKLYGQYQFNKWLGIEAAYHNTSDFEDTSRSDTLPGKLKLNFSGFSFQGLLYVPMPAEDFQAYVKGGYYDFEDDLSVDNVSNSSSSENGIVAGIGASISISDNFGIRAEYEWFDNDLGDLTAVNLGAEYYFGGPKAEAAAMPPPPPPPPEPAAEAVPEAAAVGELPPTAEAIAEPPPQADADGDGVPDENDDCPSSTAGAGVDDRGCQG